MYGYEQRVCFKPKLGYGVYGCLISAFF